MCSYFAWLFGVLHGDFGRSLTNQRDIIEELWPRFTNTLFLAGYAAAIAVPLAVGLGILSAIREGRLSDRLANMLTLIAISVPEFFVGYILIIIFAIDLGWFPSLATVFPDMAHRRALLCRHLAGADADHGRHRAYAAHDAQLRAVDHVDAPISKWPF